MQVRVKIILF